MRDPTPDPFITIDERNATLASQVLARLGMARALSLNGFPRLGFEVAWANSPSPGSKGFELLTRGERRILETPQPDRMKALLDESPDVRRFEERQTSGGFFVQEMQFDVPSIRLDSGDSFDRIVLRRGVSADLVTDLVQAGDSISELAGEKARKLSENEGVFHFESDKNSFRLDHDDVSFSEIGFSH